MKKYNYSYYKIIVLTVAIFAVMASMTLTAIVGSYAQTGSMATLQNIPATYAASIIPGAAQKDSQYHYFPPSIAVPTGTTIAWFNNDFGQPHTVTSGLPDSSDSGALFNSGIMPATANSFFQYSFNSAGDFIYHCEIHPWRIGSVSVSDSVERANNFELRSGVGNVLNLSADTRTLLLFTPLTIPLDKTTPLTYNVTIANNTDTIFTRTFVTAGDSLPVELVSSQNSETISYGPDFSSTGTYHIEGAFLDGNFNYEVMIEITAINTIPPENPIRDTFNFSTKIQ